MSANIFRTANPMINEDAFRSVSASGSATMTIEGTATKTLFLLTLVVAAAAWPWLLFFRLWGEGEPAAAMAAVQPYWVGGLIGGLVLFFITLAKKSLAMVTVPLYALCEGLLLGAVSCLFEAHMPGIVPLAVGLTLGTLFCLLVIYRLGWIRVSAQFRAGVLAATGAVAMVYLVSIVLNLFGSGVPYIHGSGPIGIGFSLFVVALAAMNLVLDFDQIERAASRGAPKWMEWYCAFGLLVTLVWLYLEILRLLSKLRSRR